MARSLSRRRILKTGIAASGVLFGSAIHPADTMARGSQSTGPDETLVRDLTPGGTPIRLAMNIRRQNNESPGDMIGRRRRDGFTAVKGARHPGGNVGEPWHSLTDSERREVMEACREHDVVIYEVGGYTNLIHPDDTVRRRNCAALAHCIEVAESVNCAMVGTIAGSRDPVNFFNVHPDNWTEATWNMLVESVRQVLRDTAGMMAAIGMEAQVTTPIDGPQAHRRLIEDIGGGRVKVNYDPANMIDLSRYYHTTELLNESFDLLGEDIAGCHAKDTYILPDQQTVHIQEVCPGRGVMDFETYLVRMSRLSWPRALEPEHIPDDEYPEAFRHIRAVAEATGVKIYGEK